MMILYNFYQLLGINMLPLLMLLSYPLVVINIVHPHLVVCLYSTMILHNSSKLFWPYWNDYCMTCLPWERRKSNFCFVVCHLYDLNYVKLGNLISEEGINVWEVLTALSFNGCWTFSFDWPNLMLYKLKHSGLFYGWVFKERLT